MSPSEPVTQEKRSLVERLRASAHGIKSGAEGMGWAPEDLYEEAATAIEAYQKVLGDIRFQASVALEAERPEPDEDEEARQRIAETREEDWKYYP